VFLAGARLRHVIVMTAIAAGALPCWRRASYRLRRLTAFLDPWADPYNSGFQLTQSLIAIGRGQWLGVGLGDSVQKLFYLPEAHTDFLFAVLAEELGLLGVLLTLALFLGLVWRSFYIARLASQAGLKFPSLLAWALAVGGHPGLHQHRRQHGRVPTKGLTLPLMSYGRSSLIVRSRVGGTRVAGVSRGAARATRIGHRAGRGMNRPILIMAGGTGGHVFPALGLARLLREQSLPVIWLGTARGLESRVIPAEGIPIERLSVGGLRGKGVPQLAGSALSPDARPHPGAARHVASSAGGRGRPGRLRDRSGRRRRMAHAPAAAHS